MDNNIQKYEIYFEGKYYILTTEIYLNKIIITCFEKNSHNYLDYYLEASLQTLRQISPVFYSFLTIQEAQNYINKIIEEEQIQIGKIGNQIQLILLLNNQNYNVNYTQRYYFPISQTHSQVQNIFFGNSNNNRYNEIKNSHDTIMDDINNLSNEVNNLKYSINKMKNSNNNLIHNYNQNQYQKTNGNFTNEILLKQEIERLSNQLNKIKNNSYNQKLIKVKMEELQRENQNLKLQINNLRNYNNNSKLAQGDIIHNVKEKQLILRKLYTNFSYIIVHLIYKATVDTDKAEAFHRNCDRAKNTLVLIESGNGKRFGGFTSCHWKGNSIIKKDNFSFLFSLDKMEIYNVFPGEDAIGCFPNLGPFFCGPQIKINDDAFTNGGSTAKKGLNYKTNEDYELTGGLPVFSILEIEVYSVQFE